jgi:hypothetical protein
MAMIASPYAEFHVVPRPAELPAPRAGANWHAAYRPEYRPFVDGEPVVSALAAKTGLLGWVIMLAAARGSASIDGGHGKLVEHTLHGRVTLQLVPWWER